MRAIFEFLIRVLKWLPRPLVPLVPIVITLLGPVTALVLIVYSVQVPHGAEVAGLSAKASNGNGVTTSSASGEGSRTTAISAPTSKM